MKLTHCDLFFADAVILVEGNVERLLLPSIIEKSQPSLKSNYLTILEVGGAFAHKFDSLLGLLGLPTLVITDLDSVGPSSQSKEENIDLAGAGIEDREESRPAPGKSCPADIPSAVTANITLRDWHPQKSSIKELLELNNAAKEFSIGGDGPTTVRVAYQTPTVITKDGIENTVTGRTFEETFAHENLEWVLSEERRDLSLLPARFDRKDESLDKIVAAIHKRVKGSSFKKTDFALNLMLSPDEWQPPSYIVEGLNWLDAKLNARPVANLPTPGSEEVAVS